MTSADIPIIVISASTFALDAIRSIKHGALTFLNKAMPFARNEEECKTFFKHFKNTIEFGAKLGDPQSLLRTLAKRMQSIRSITHEGWFTTEATTQNWHGLAFIDPEVLEILGRHYGDDSVIRPPIPSCWGDELADRLFLLYELYHACWMNCMLYDENLAWNGCIPVDYWRQQELLLSKHGDIARVIELCISYSAGLLDLMAQWYWCWRHGREIPSVSWGATVISYPKRQVIEEIQQLLSKQAQCGLTTLSSMTLSEKLDSITSTGSIAQEISNLLMKNSYSATITPDVLWDIRNALVHNANPTACWGLAFLELIVLSAVESVEAFLLVVQDGQYSNLCLDCHVPMSEMCE